MSQEIAPCAPCSSCPALMRPHGTRLSDYPGTVTRSNVTECMGCYRRRDRAEARAAAAALAAEREIRLHNDLAGYFAGRRRRGIPMEGLRY